MPPKKKRGHKADLGPVIVVPKTGPIAYPTEDNTAEDHQPTTICVVGNLDRADVAAHPTASVL